MKEVNFIHQNVQVRVNVREIYSIGVSGRAICGEATYRQSENCFCSTVGSMKVQGRQWWQPWDRVASQQDTGVVKVSNTRQN